MVATKDSKTSKAARKPEAASPLPDPHYLEGAARAREYFAGLTTAPASVELAGYLAGDVPKSPGDEGLIGFGDTLQALLVKAFNEKHSSAGETAEQKGALTQRQIEHQIDSIASEIYALKKLGVSIQCDTDSHCDYGLCVTAIAGMALRRADAVLVSLGSIPVAHSNIDEEILEELKDDAEEAA